MKATGWFLGTSLDVRSLDRNNVLADTPLTLKVGQKGYAVLFRFGVAVFFDLNLNDQSLVLEKLKSSIHKPFAEPETEEAGIIISAQKSERVSLDGIVTLQKAGIEHLQTVAYVIAKSVVLAHYENHVATVFKRIELLIKQVEQGLIPARGKLLVQEIGNVLSIQTWTVGRVEVTEKPEITWEDYALDRLYERMAAAYELVERDLALSRKLDLITKTAETLLELHNTRQSLRLELYIVLLFIFEIVVVMLEMFL
ncbi:MAG: RMD1 family protein [Desulfohalobiaceae bacterium]|nr:RMD1 family protein [Desulfohalobiaceae bacterium]